MSFTANPSEVLLTLAEVAVAFGGFASIVAIFQARWTQRDEPFDLFRFGVMLVFSLATLLFTLLPFALYFLGLGESAIWRVSSVLLALFVIANGLVIACLVARRVPAVVSSLNPWISAAANVVYGITLVAQIAKRIGNTRPPGLWALPARAAAGSPRSGGQLRSPGLGRQRASRVPGRMTL